MFCFIFVVLFAKMDHFKYDIEPKSKPGYGFGRSFLQICLPYRVIFLTHTSTVNIKSMLSWLVASDKRFVNEGAVCQVIGRLSFLFALNQLNGYYRLVWQVRRMFTALPCIGGPAFFYSSQFACRV